jgi:hypothetical protein
MQLKVMALLRRSSSDAERVEGMASSMRSKQLHTCSQGPLTKQKNFD